MKLTPQITFRDMEPSPFVEAAINKRIESLDRFFERITSCKVTVEAPHKHHHKGGRFRVCVDLTVPGAELVVGREHGLDGAHEDVYVAIRDAFDAARRVLEDRSRLGRRKVRHREGPDHGRVTRLLPDKGYGFIASDDGREIYFHRNSVLRGWNSLKEGTEVRFAEEKGDNGPQASTVTVVVRRAAHPPSAP